MPWLAHHNPEIDQRTGEVKMMWCSKKYRKQCRPKQRKKRKKERNKKRRSKRRRKKEKERKNRKRRGQQKEEIWDEEEEAAKSKEEAKKLAPQRFHKQIHVFGKKVSERMLTKKVQDHAIETKRRFVPRKGKVYLLLKKERGEM